MNKTRVLVAVGIFISLANVVMTYSCFEIQEHQFMHVQQAVYDAINMIDDNLQFEHKEE